MMFMLVGDRWWFFMRNIGVNEMIMMNYVRKK